MIKSSIAAKIVLIILLATVPSLLSFGLFSYYIEKESREKNLYETTERIGLRISHNLALPVWDYIYNSSILGKASFEAASRTIDDEMREKSVGAILVYGNFGQFFTGKIRTASSIETMKINQHDNLKNSFIVKTLPIESQGISIGKIEIHMTDLVLKKELSQQKRFIFMQVSMVSLFILITLIAALKFFVVRRVQMLKSGVLFIKNGNFENKIEISSRDEIGLLGEAFNSLMSQLNENILNKKQLLQELYDKNQILEEEIESHEKDETELRRTRNYLRNVFDSLSSALISVNDSGIVTQWNRAAELLTAIPSKEAFSKHVREVVPFLTDVETFVVKAIKEREHNQFYRETEFGNYAKKHLFVAIHPLAYDGIGGAVIRIDDVTEMVQKDEQLRQAQKMEIVGNLAGGIAHDFNNMLGGIIGTVSLIKYSFMLGKFTTEELQNRIELIESSAKRAADMVTQLLALSRKKELSFTAVNLNDSLMHVVALCHNTFDKSVDIKAQYYDGDALVNADATQIEQVFLNLLVNAAHAMTIMRNSDEKQGGIIAISVDKKMVDALFTKAHPAAREIDYFLISFRDSGVGMEKEVFSKIFDPFFTTKQKGKGSGLGLSMVYSIIKQHRGFIDVYSELGIGSVFNVFLPAAEKDTQNGIPKKTIENHGLIHGAGLILAVDDEEIIRITLKSILEECGYTVLLAADGEDGLRKFIERKDEIDLVISDMVMPKMSGKDLFFELIKLKADVKVIMSSGFKQDSRVQETLANGAKGFLQKPYSMQELSQIVHDILISENPLT